jgi:RNA polymerase sigma factor (sigma-70 family)
MDEQALIQRCQTGDVRAFEPLFQANIQMAVRTAYVITQDWARAEDAAQEAFIRAFQKIRSFRLGEPFRSWLHRIVINEARRLVAKFPKTRTEIPVEISAPDDERPEETVLERERLSLLQKAIQRLKDEHQLVITLKYFTKCSEAEIATVLGVPQSTVKSRLYVARQKLTEIMVKERRSSSHGNGG